MFETKALCTSPRPRPSKIVRVRDQGQGHKFPASRALEAEARPRGNTSLTEINDGPNSNQLHHLPPPDSQHISSAKTKNVFQATDEPIDTNKDCYIIIKLNMLNNLLEHVVCPFCNDKNSKIEINNNNHGIVKKLIVSCMTCNNNISSTMTSPRMGKGDSKSPFELSKLNVACTMEMGTGMSGFEKLCTMLNMPSMHHKTYANHAKDIAKKTEIIASDSTNKAVVHIKEVYRKMGEANQDNITNIMVSFDGSWHKRGHTSNFGFGGVIDVITGLVIDHIVLSKYCHGCSTVGNKMDKNSDEFKTWMSNHKCDKNFDGSSGAMEVAAAKILFGRSIQKHSLRYTTMLSDGDAKTFKHLSDINIYGAEYPLEKEECLNHVAKRLGTALRKAAKEKHLGGRGQGRLTDGKIKVLTNYYYGAIVSNREKGVDAMRNAVFATLFHCMSTDASPHHLRCPPGNESWCFYQRALAKGEAPPSHQTNVKHSLSYEVAQELMPIYQRLGNEDLLKRCLLGKTQNSNECLHSMIWRHCPKTQFVSKSRIEAGASLAVSQYNQGIYLSTKALLQELDIKMGQNTELLTKSKDKERIQKADKKLDEAVKEERKRKRLQMILENERNEQNGRGSLICSRCFLICKLCDYYSNCLYVL